MGSLLQMKRDKLGLPCLSVFLAMLGVEISPWGVDHFVVDWSEGGDEEGICLGWLVKQWRGRNATLASFLLLLKMPSFRYEISKKIDVLEVVNGCRLLVEHRQRGEKK